MKYGDALWVGVDIDKGPGGVPAINVFRKVGDAFKLVKMIDGDEALKLYSMLTHTDTHVEDRNHDA